MREYEHGVHSYGGVPVFNPRVPPPVVLNSVASNPLLLDNYRQRDPSFNVASFNSHIQNALNVDPSPPLDLGVPDYGQHISHATLFTMFKSLESQVKVLQDENIRLKGGGVGPSHGREDMDEDQGDDELLEPSGAGIYLLLIFPGHAL